MQPSAIDNLLSYKKEELNEYIENLFAESQSLFTIVHNYERTKDVADAAMRIANGSDCSTEEVGLVYLAAMFHLTCYAKGVFASSEISQMVARSFMLENGLEEDQVNCVKSLIAIANGDYAPVTKLEKIICDATTAFYGEKKISAKLKDLRILHQSLDGIEIPSLDWAEAWKEKLIAHTYHMQISKSLYDRRKTKNIVKISGKINKLYLYRELKIINSFIEEDQHVTSYETLEKNTELLTVASEALQGRKLSAGASSPFLEVCYKLLILAMILTTATFLVSFTIA